jgi:hypothetical protein
LSDFHTALPPKNTETAGFPYHSPFFFRALTIMLILC